MEPGIDLDIKKELEEIQEVPTLPQVAFKLIAMISDPNSSMTSISRVIEEDPPLVAKILKIINSGFYNVRNRITNVHQAIVLLGMEEVKNLVFALSVYSTFYHIQQNQYFNFSQFWKHSASTAKMAIVLSKYLGFDFRQADFIGGLLHDFGRLVLQLYFRDIYEGVFRFCEEKMVPLYQAEKEYLGFTHAEAGFWLSQRWNLPDEVASVIKFHHEVKSEDIDQNKLRVIIHLAEKITNLWGVTLEPVPVFNSIEEVPIWNAMLERYPKLKSFPLEEMTKVFNMHVEEAEIFVDHIERIHNLGST